jgi:hypothetical protein
MAVLLLGRRALSWRSRGELVPYCFLPFLRKNRTVKPWDQTSKTGPTADFFNSQLPIAKTLLIFFQVSFEQMIFMNQAAA